MRLGLLLGAMMRESRGSRGRLLFFVLSLAVGVAAVVGVSGLVGSIEDGIASQSRELLAADLRVSSRAPLSPEARAVLDAELAALETGTGAVAGRAEVRELVSMASADASRLVEIKAVEAGYPFYGELVVEPADAVLTDSAAIIAPELADALGLALGHELRLGDASFEVVGLLLDEPDRLEFSMTLGPRVFLTAGGLERTGLLQFGSRVRHRTLIALPDLDRRALSELAERLERELGLLAGARPPRIETPDGAQQNVRDGLHRVERFLGLVALLSLLLGGIGVAQIVRAWIAERTPAVAVLRCIGFRPRDILAMYLSHVLLLALFASLLGATVGSLLPVLAPRLAPDLLSADLVRAWQPGALLRGVVLGVSVAALFSISPLTAVWRVSPARVLRAEADPLPAPRMVRYGSLVLLALGVLASAWYQSGELDFAAGFSGGLLVLAGALIGAAALLLRLSRRIRRSGLSPYLVHGLAALGRPSAGTTGAIVALGLGVLVVVAMLLVQNRLEQELVGALPEDAPTVFLIDIQPDQWEGVRDLLEREGAGRIDSVPVVTGRLASVDGVSVDELTGDDDPDEGGRRRGRRRGRWVLTREQRLTWLAELPDDNELVAGELWSDPERAEVSIEEGFARDMGVEVGSTIVFDVQGVPIELLVSSLRSVVWESFAINFFLVVEPGPLDEAPHYRIAAAQLDEASETPVQNALGRTFPNVTVLRVRPILEKVRNVLTKAALGIRTLGGFTILVGIAVLAGAISAGGVRRAREAALLRTLGVTRRGVTLLFGIEYALVGLVAGAVGGLFAYGGAYLFLEHVLEIEPALPLLPLGLSLLASALLSVGAGIAASGRALSTPPLASLSV